MNFRTMLIALLPLSVLLANAHPGHDLLQHGAAHAATSPYHIAVLGICALVMLAVAQIVRSSAAKKYLRWGGAVALIAAVAMWGLGI